LKEQLVKVKSVKSFGAVNSGEVDLEIRLMFSCALHFKEVVMERIEFLKI
jgi:hypothetical protein